MKLAISKLEESLILSTKLEIEESMEKYKESFEIFKVESIKCIDNSTTDEEILKVQEQIKDYETKAHILNENLDKLKKFIESN